ncbi:MAG TPA: hypothetical protein DCP78_22400 [Sphingobacterium sp.]|nr:hypothetical protein [Sphingobacterium sp.]
MAEYHTEHPDLNTTAIPAELTKVAEVDLCLFTRKAVQRNKTFCPLEFTNVTGDTRIRQGKPMLLDQFLVDQQCRKSTGQIMLDLFMKYLKTTSTGLMPRS